jgi:hypothetical protein
VAEAVRQPVEAAAVACKSEAHGYRSAIMSARAYQFRQDDSRSDLRDLDRAALTAAVVSDDGDALPPGTEGTIVSVYRDGEAYVVEFPMPLGALATVRPDDLKLIQCDIRPAPSS